MNEGMREGAHRAPRVGVGIVVTLVGASLLAGCSRYPAVQFSERREYQQVEERRPDEDRAMLGIGVREDTLLVSVVRARACGLRATETVITQPGRPAKVPPGALGGGLLMGVGTGVALVGLFSSGADALGCGLGGGGGGCELHKSSGNTIAAVGLVTMVVGNVIVIVASNGNPPPPPPEIRTTLPPRISASTICARDPIANVVVEVASLESPLHATGTTASDGTLSLPIAAELWAVAPLDVVVRVPGEPLAIVRVTKAGVIGPASGSVPR